MARAFVAPAPLSQPPPRRSVDPYQVNPYIFFARPYLQTYIPGSHYDAERVAFTVPYHINRRGFRGPEIPARGPASPRRLVVIGDSIVEGHGVEFDDAFPARLGVALEDRRWEVINAGMAGASPIYFAANVPRYLAMDPDAVLLVLFENDLTDDRNMEPRLQSLPALDDDEAFLRGAPPGGGGSWSRLYEWLRRMWNDVTFKRSPVARIAARNGASVAPTEEQARWSAAAAYLIAPSMIDRQWTMSQAYLDYAVEAFRQKGVSVLIADICMGTLAPGPNEEWHHVHCRQLDERIVSWARRRNLPVLSLVPTMARLFETRRAIDLMIPYDGHPTAAAHAAIAAALSPWLTEHLP